MSPKIVDKEKRKEELLEAAIKVFARKGYADTTMDNVAKAANVSKGMIYEYFSSKDDLLVELYNYFEKVTFSKLVKKIAFAKSSRKKIKIFIEYSFGIYTEMFDFINILFVFWAEGIIKKSENKLDISSVYSNYRGFVAEIIKQGIDSGEFRKVDTYTFSAIIFGAMDGLCLQWILDMENFPAKKASEELSKMILKSLEKEEKG